MSKPPTGKLYPPFLSLTFESCNKVCVVISHLPIPVLFQRLLIGPSARSNEVATFSNYSVFSVKQLLPNSKSIAQ